MTHFYQNNKIFRLQAIITVKKLHFQASENRSLWCMYDNINRDALEFEGSSLFTNSIVHTRKTSGTMSIKHRTKVR